VARLTTKFEKLPQLSADFVASRIAQALAEGRQSLILRQFQPPLCISGGYRDDSLRR
jgi:hypothetical protein